MTTLTASLKTIDASTLQVALTQNEVLVVDVREPSEHAAEKIAGARSLPLSQLKSPDQFPFTTGKTIVLYCQTGNRSSQAAQKLLAAGLRTVMHLEGGLHSWKQRGYPTEIDKSAPISLLRQVQIVAGSLVVTGTLLGALVSPRFLILSGFVGAGLVFAGVSNTCAMATLLAKLPYNQPKSAPAQES